MKDQLDAQASARLSTLLNTPAMRSRLVGQLRPMLTTLPDGSSAGGTPAPAPSSGVPVWAFGVAAFALAVGGAFFVWRK